MTKPRLLIVEDTDFSRDLLVQIFEETYEIDTAGEAATALEAATRRSPDVILMDIRLPGFSGLDAARAIRQRLPDVPIVAVTSQVMPGDEERAVAAGCDAFIAKPIDDVRLVELVDRLLRAR